MEAQDARHARPPSRGRSDEGRAHGAPGLPGSLAAACALTTCQAFPLLASVGSRRPRGHGEVEGVLGEENLAKKESDFF